MKLLNKVTIVFLSALLGFIFFNPANSFGQLDSSSVRNLLEERDKEMKDLLGPKGTEYTQKQRDQLKDIINGIIDYRAMAQQALQTTYDTLSEEQRTEFVDLFSTIIRDQSLNKLDIYRADIKYEQIKVEDSSATVQTLAQLERVRTPVTYNMKYKGESEQWVVTDMIIDDVSTAGSYQRQFQNVIRKKGYNSLLETLRKRAAK
ncbi:MlaC/ttg2D family ABC transporter substrate-binding protein [Fodinibius sp. SL11]|uniref:MlaC/ttg2D family ABC transporter substrate-binding protein n=1 Tax=Fodinibius sp. SL11 TaxID=3425690 RepID=UPI003F884781